MGRGWRLENSYRQLPEIFYTPWEPVAVRAPELVLFNEDLARSLGLPSLTDTAGVEILAGNNLPPGSQPLAQAYGGHQFGHFTMLGDGRAILLGEQITPQGERYDIQLKGAGRTPYSRGGDGRAALGPMLREYLISEAMDALGIPTTRSLAVVLTGETITREKELPGTILTRVASSHIRVGTFQYAAVWGSREDLQALADYTIQRHFPSLQREDNPYLALLKEVMARQARLIAQWQLVGFIHGVMNTDNMAISGETIDYGPCAFIDTYDPATVFSSIDTYGRYAYGRQPQMGLWNLARFAESLLPLIHEDLHQGAAMAQGVLEEFESIFRQHWLTGMGAKLGLVSIEGDDESLIEELLQIMEVQKADYTNTFLALTFQEPADLASLSSPEFHRWYEDWQKRIKEQGLDPVDLQQRMKRANPALIPRNHRVEEALAAAAEGDYQVIKRFLAVLRQPYAHSPEQKEYAAPPPPSACPYHTFCGT
ncbi:MAG: protein adenylyltransferase SelO [Limnochordia bacterium]|jgi:uncharacterized protein YdiU (UPF0061 family)